MSDWAEGYHAALRDMEVLAASRSLSSEVSQLVVDLKADADVIDHDLTNRRQRSKLRSERELRPVRQERLL